MQPEQCAGIADVAEGGAHVQVRQVHVQPAGCSQGALVALAGGAKINEHRSITLVMRRPAVPFRLFYFLSDIHRSTLFVLLAAAGVFSCCGHIGWTRGRGKAANGYCVVRLGFLISEDVTLPRMRPP